jgi:hypothetical protein
MAEAYAKAYSSTMARGKRDVEAKRLEKDSRIVRRIHELAEAGKTATIAKVAEEIAVDRTRIIAELWDNSQKAKTAVPVLDKKGVPTGEYTANWQASNAALIAIGKDIGMFGEKTDRANDPLKELSHDEAVALFEMAQDELRRRTAAADGALAARPAKRATH